MNEIEIFLRFSFLALSSIMCIISVLSTQKAKDLKIVYASLGFLVFTIEGFLLSIGVFLPSVETMITKTVLVGTSFIALVFYFLSILKR